MNDSTNFDIFRINIIISKLNAHTKYSLTRNKTNVTHQDLFVLGVITGEESEHGSQVRVVQSAIKGRAHVSPQRLSFAVPAQRHSNHVETSTWQPNFVMTLMQLI